MDNCGELKLTKGEPRGGCSIGEASPQSSGFKVQGLGSKLHLALESEF